MNEYYNIIIIIPLYGITIRVSSSFLYYNYYNSPCTCNDLREFLIIKELEKKCITAKIIYKLEIKSSIDRQIVHLPSVFFFLSYFPVTYIWFLGLISMQIAGYNEHVIHIQLNRDQHN